MVSKKRYKELLLRAVHQVLSPFDVSEEDLADLVFDQVKQLELWPGDDNWDDMPADLKEELSLAEALFAPYTIFRNSQEG